MGAHTLKNIQFCCGGNRLSGWDNFDSDCDISKPIPFLSGVYDMALIEHGLEHFSCGDGFRFLEECVRILKPGGILRVCVPHLDRIQDKAHCRDLIVGHGHQVVFNLPLLINLLHLAGFKTVYEVKFDPTIDGHFKIIGEAKDSLETLRVHAVK